MKVSATTKGRNPLAMTINRSLRELPELIEKLLFFSFKIFDE